MKSVWSLVFILCVIFFLASLAAILLKRFRMPAALAALAFLAIGLVSIFMNSRAIESARIFTADQSDTIKRTAKSIEYETLARQPEMYVGHAVYFEGRVIQVVDSGLNMDMRINITKTPQGVWLNTIFVTYRRPSVTAPRALQGDIIKLYGEYRGLTQYRNVMGGIVQIPLVAAAVIEISAQLPPAAAQPQIPSSSL